MSKVISYRALNGTRGAVVALVVAVVFVALIEIRDKLVEF